MDTVKWTQYAMERVKELHVNDVFRLKDLFTPHEWNELSNQEKRAFGRFFSMECKEERTVGVVPLGKGKGNQNLYRKVRTENE